MSASRLRELYPLPNTDGIKSYYFSLDGGGREMISDVIRSQNVRVMIEIGCFLCGSTRQWLDASPDLTVIGIDPWAGNFGSILDRYVGKPAFMSCWKSIPDQQEFIDSVRRHGPYASALANVKEYGSRFIPVKDKSPEVLPKLHDLGVSPDLIYIDSTKHLNDLEVCHDLFPNAILCGDDWTWGAPEYPARTAVTSFCERYGYAVEARRATWLIKSSRTT